MDCEDLVEDNKIRNGENDIETADYVKFFLLTYIDGGAISAYFINFVIIIAVIKTASIY
jgi:hypothetical protein